jgi:hypothetical protein
MQDRDPIAEQHGFRPLGPITVTSQRALRFPSPPVGGGLYLIDLNAGGRYIGETARYGRDGTKSGRFDHYTNPADDIWTELVIHEMLLAGGGFVYILPAEGDKRFRQRLVPTIFGSRVVIQAMDEDCPLRDRDYAFERRASCS